MVMVLGEITTKAKVDYEAVVRKVCRDVGFISDDVGLSADTCKVLMHLHEQSPEIGEGVHGMGTKTLEQIGAGDQGHMFGYATDETEELMPLTHVLATKLGYRCAARRACCALDCCALDCCAHLCGRHVDQVAADTLHQGVMLARGCVSTLPAYLGKCILALLRHCTCAVASLRCTVQHTVALAAEGGKERGRAA